jgi:acetyl/propionyl-CoA carboxylase alpha subunit
MSIELELDGAVIHALVAECSDDSYAVTFAGQDEAPKVTIIDTHTAAGQDEAPKVTIIDTHTAAGQDEAPKVTIIDAHTAVVTSGQAHQRASVAVSGEQIHVFVGGETYAFSKSDSRARRRATGQQLDQHITPPMPGQVTRIEVSAGDTVVSGQTVVVISAMKMETPLKATKGGTIEAIHTVVGAQVRPGQILVDIR